MELKPCTDNIISCDKKELELIKEALVHYDQYLKTAYELMYSHQQKINKTSVEQFMNKITDLQVICKDLNIPGYEVG